MEQSIIRRIDDLGRIAIPKDIRRMLRLSDGDALEISASGCSWHSGRNTRICASTCTRAPNGCITLPPAVMRMCWRVLTTARCEIWWKRPI